MLELLLRGGNLRHQFRLAAVSGQRCSGLPQLRVEDVQVRRIIKTRNPLRFIPDDCKTGKRVEQLGADRVHDQGLG
jgi:hypothetical protein